MRSGRKNAGAPPAYTLMTFHILLALADGERHGSGILREVAAYSAGWYTVKSDLFYRTLRQLLEAELIAEAAERPEPALDDRRRRYYRLTDTGRWAARAEVARMRQLVEVAKAKAL